jgi:hypothetical protein
MQTVHFFGVGGRRRTIRPDACTTSRHIAWLVAGNEVETKLRRAPSSSIDRRNLDQSFIDLIYGSQCSRIP